MKTRDVVVAFALGLLGAATAHAGAAPQLDEPPTVEDVELTRYVGLWYEIASIPQSFERDCVASQALYALRSDGRLSITNSCRLGSFHGEWKSAHGVARSLYASNAKLKVSFFWPFEADYWIFELGDDYEYAVVGSPDRESLWILSRTRQLPEETLAMLMDRIAGRLGFDVGRVVMTPQPEGGGGAALTSQPTDGRAAPPRPQIFGRLP